MMHLIGKNHAIEKKDQYRIEYYPQLIILLFLYSFGFDEEEKDDIVYTTWLSLSLRALTNIFNYSPTSKKWTQAHR